MKNSIFHSIIFYVLTLILLISCTGKNRYSPEPEQADHSGHTPINSLSLSRQDEYHANITIDTVREKFIAEYTTMLGTTNIDERNITVITSRVSGRLDKLYIRDHQQWIAKGQPLYAIYSEELLTYEKELLIALEQQYHLNTMSEFTDRLVEKGRKKLLLLGLSAEQIEALEKEGEASPLVTFFSPVSGTLTELEINDGQYVETGTPLFRIADLSRLWIEAQMYPEELTWLSENPVVRIEFEAYPGEFMDAKPVFENPVLENDQKISLVRFVVFNKGRKLKPGMMAYVNIKRNEKKTLVIPKSSILIGNMVTAWIKTSDGIYESRMLELGIQNKKEVEVLSGLKEGDIIVTNGAYLLNSAQVLKNGGGMAGMEHHSIN